MAKVLAAPGTDVVPECFRFGIIGAGVAAKAHADALSGCANARVGATYDPVADRSQALAARTGAHANASYRELLYEEALNGVIVCTPPASHSGAAFQALEAGVHVLCEKPLSVDVDSAKQMYDAAAAADRVLMLASKFRYAADVRELKKLVRSGALGAIAGAEIVLSGEVAMRGQWNADPARSGGGVIIDLGSLAVDLARFLFGEIESVKAAVYASRQHLQVEDSACMVLRSRSGVRIAVDVTWSFRRDLAHFVRIDGSSGAAWAGWNRSEFIDAAHGRHVLLGTGYDDLRALCEMHRDFIDACSGGRPQINPVDGLAAAAAIEAAYRSLATGAAEPITKRVRGVRK